MVPHGKSSESIPTNIQRLSIPVNVTVVTQLLKLKIHRLVVSGRGSAYKSILRDFDWLGMGTTLDEYVLLLVTPYKSFSQVESLNHNGEWYGKGNLQYPKFVLNSISQKV